MALSFGRRIAFSGLAAAISIAFSLAAAEGLLRLRYRHIARITGVTDWQTVEWQGLSYHWDEYHPRYGWTNRAGYRSGVGSAELPFQLAINSQGLRGSREYSPQPAPGARRILLFGDSLAFGEDVDDAETVSHYLEGMLPNTEVLNFGVHGYGLGQMMLRLEDEAFALHPDHLLVMLLVPRDLTRDLKRDFVHAKPIFGERQGRLSIDNLPVPTTSSQTWLERHSFVAAYLFARAANEAQSDDPDLHLRVGRLLLQRIQARALAEGVPVTLVSVSSAPDLERLHREAKERRRLDAARSALALPDLDVLDLIGFLERRVRSEGRALATKTFHWSPRGNCLIAGEIAKHLARGGATFAPVGSLRQVGRDCPPLEPAHDSAEAGSR